MTRHIYRMRAGAALIAGVLFAGPVVAQPGATLRVTRNTVIMEAPRGDSTVLESIMPGTVLEILDRRGDWYQVRAPRDAQTSWARGWIQRPFVELLSGGPNDSAGGPRGELMIRGFGQADGSLFTARDSFETIVGSAFGPTFGGGAQIAFAAGTFVEASIARFRKTGSRALVSGTQVFKLQTPAVVTVMPIQFTVGYRAPRTRVVPYVGAGAGWHSLKEESPSLQQSGDIDDGHIGYHLAGGVEYAIGSWLALAGEVQWATVPGVLGKSGVSAVFNEDDLGQTSFRVKFFVGR